MRAHVIVAAVAAATRTQCGTEKIEKGNSSETPREPPTSWPSSAGAGAAKS